MSLAKLLARRGAVLLAAGALAAPSMRAEENKKVDKQIHIARSFSGGAYLGVELNDTAGDVRGALVREVSTDTPAAKAGLKAGDLIVRFDGEAVRSAAHLARLVRETPVGRSVALEAKREGALQKFDVTLAERKGSHAPFGGDEGELAWGLAPEPPDAPGPPEAPRSPRPPRVARAPHPPLPSMPRMFRWHSEGDADGFDFLLGRGPRKLGIRYQEISGQLAKYVRLADDQGVLVADVDDSGPAGKAGLRAGDVILKFGATPVKDGDALRRAVADAEPGSKVTLFIWRDGKPLDLEVTLAGEKEPHSSGETT